MNRKVDTHHKPEASPVAAQTASSPVLFGRQGVSSESVLGLHALDVIAASVTNGRLTGLGAFLLI